VAGLFDLRRSWSPASAAFSAKSVFRFWRHCGDAPATRLERAKTLSNLEELVAGAGFEIYLTRSSKLVMVHDFWSKRLMPRQLRRLEDCSHVLSMERESTRVLETLWRRPKAGPFPSEWRCSSPGTRYARYSSDTTSSATWTCPKPLDDSTSPRRAGTLKEGNARRRISACRSRSTNMFRSDSQGRS
jgi:hypothetical protein